MKCPKCKSENKDGAKFCMRCGLNLVSHSDTVPISDYKPKHKQTKSSVFGTPYLRHHSISRKSIKDSIFRFFSSISNFFLNSLKRIKKHIKVKPKKILVPISIVVIVLICVLVAIHSLFSPPNFKDGNYWKNISKFGASSDGLSPVTKEYSKLISYTVESQGADSREKGWIEIRVGVPDVSKELIDIMNSDLTIDGNTNEEMTESLNNYIADRFKEGHYKYNYETFRLDLKRDGFEWKIVPTQELSDFMYAPIYDAYREALRQQFEQSDPPEIKIPEDDTEDEKQEPEE